MVCLDEDGDIRRGRASREVGATMRWLIRMKMSCWEMRRRKMYSAVVGAEHGVVKGSWGCINMG